ncbi:MAG: protein kinase [Ectothiorhodospiraceae bacterium]|nr:protein kinase [Chromatiales bacterium]MCP5154746.1 protein kinase [Ectothiorhodospiraceae bacterium]
MTATAPQRIRGFEFVPGRILAGKYEVVHRLGAGWEGEVYLVRERATGIERAAKLFFPDRNPGDRSARNYAKKLHRLGACEILIQYHSQESIRFRGHQVTVLVSDYVRGELLSDFLRRQRGRRLAPFPALHLLHALALGVECIHAAGEYHGDLHSENIVVERYGLRFELKLFDLFHWTGPKTEAIRGDVVEMVRVFHEALGGARHYAGQPAEVKAICCGLKRTLILRKFRTAGQLRRHIEALTWQ